MLTSQPTQNCELCRERHCLKKNREAGKEDIFRSPSGYYIVTKTSEATLYTHKVYYLIKRQSSRKIKQMQLQSKRNMQIKLNKELS